MQARESTWDLPERATTSLGGGLIEHQPAFGIYIMWNRPREWWRLVLIIAWWRWILQIGWLVD